VIARTVLLAAALLLTAAPAGFAAVPDAIHATYDVLRGNMRIGTAQETFEKKGGLYHLVSDSTPSGLLALFVRARVRMQSSGTITSAGLRPDQFEYARLDDAGRNASATFDWRASQLRLKFDQRSEVLPLPSNTQDRLSLMYQFMFLPLDKLKLIPVNMTNGRKIESYEYRAAGNVAVETPLGKMNTLHLIKQRDAGDKNEIEVWLATERSFVPVKVLIVESDGSRFEQIISRLEIK
jgi:Protein of unknown function (DUF3108)